MLKRLLVNQSALLLQYAVNGVVPLLLVPHVVRAIGLYEFGLLSIALSFAAYGALIVNYGFMLTAPPKIVQAPPEQRGSLVRAILRARIALTGIVLGMFAIAIVALSLAGRPLSAPELAMLFSLPLAACFNMSWYLQALERFGIIAGCSIVAVAVAMTIAFILVEPNGPNATLAAAAALTAGPLLTGVLTGAAGLRILRREASGAAGRQSARKELQEGWLFFVSQAVAGLYGASGVLVVGAIAGAEQAGAYSAAERIANAVAGACLLIHTAAYPRLSALYHDDRAQYLRHLLLVLLVYWSSAVAVCIGAAIFWTDVQTYIFGSASMQHAWLLAMVLGVIASMVYGTLYTGYLTVAGRGRDVLPLTVRLLILSLIVGLPSVWLWGAAGWLATIWLSYAVVGIVGWRVWRNTTARRRSATDREKAHEKASH